LWPGGNALEPRGYEEDCELQARCIGAEEIDNLGEYLIQPVDRPGIFYVTGVTYSSAWLTTTTGVARELQAVRHRIRVHGVPAPSFVHPPLKVSAPTFVRIVCPVCGHWVEVVNAGILYSFWTGLEPFSEQFHAARQAVQVAKPFVERHFRCLQSFAGKDTLRFVYPSDERFDLLDDAMRE
jgi:hypothetical protein